MSGSRDREARPFGDGPRTQLSVPSGRRLLPVRLTDIRKTERIKVARRLARSGAGDPIELLHAALHPSDTVYWVAPSALPQLRRIAA